MNKNERIARQVEAYDGRGFSPYYAGYFECFNQGRYYEAHDVLEQLWLPSRGGLNDAFYKGLIQLAGAFVHLQKNRPRPAAALFKLARANLQRYPAVHESLALPLVLALISTWLARLEDGAFAVNPLGLHPAPRLVLESHTV